MPKAAGGLQLEANGDTCMPEQCISQCKPLSGLVNKTHSYKGAMGWYLANGYMLKKNCHFVLATHCKIYTVGSASLWVGESGEQEGAVGGGAI